MAGTRKHIARWRRTKHVAMVLCVQSVVLLALSCSVGIAASLSEKINVGISEAALSASYFSQPFKIAGLTPSRLIPVGDLWFGWNSPRMLPGFSRDVSPSQGWSVLIPLWPLPVAFGALAWCAGRKIKRVWRGACPNCGYDTRGLGAGACCPECGTTCTV